MMTEPELWCFIRQLLAQGVEPEEVEEKARYELRITIEFFDYDLDRSSMDDQGVRP